MVTQSFGDVVADIQAKSTSEADKGRRFERVVKAYLKADAFYAERYSQVWLWGEWPGNKGKGDTGIDIVAEIADGSGLAAIQCKFYASGQYIDKPRIDSFMTASGVEGFTERIIVSTTSNWSRNANDALLNQQVSVTRLGPADFEASSIDWSRFDLDEPEVMEQKAPKSTRPHQQEAINAVLAGFREHDRGKMIMACGTGKTYTALRIAEQQVAPGGTILFLTPSLQLVSQSLREWANDASVPMRFFAVCSDTSVGRRVASGDEDESEINSYEMVIPATTSAARLVDNLGKQNDESRTVIFCTYQSLDVIAQAQKSGMGKIHLAICDEAHRTTGVTLAEQDESEFTKIHYDHHVLADKRLYMTATPRIYTEKSKGKAREADAALASMDDEAIYGPEFYRLNFGDAVEKDLLCDYRVLIFGVNENAVATDLQTALSEGPGSLSLNDAAKIVASWNAISKQKSEYEDFGDDPEAMRRVVAFASRIRQSQEFTQTFNGTVQQYVESKGIADDLQYESRHVDGTQNAMARAEKLAWLAGDADGECRILSNARCLTEGVDVPALDGILFLSPRRSTVEVVQAVGRAMRKSEGKKYGYIVIPIAVTPDGDYRKAILDSNYNATWQVLQALKAHDETFYDALNQTDLRLSKKVSVIFDESLTKENSTKEASDIAQQIEMPLSLADELREAIYARIVDSLTDKHYYSRWAKDVERISQEYEARIEGILNSGNEDARRRFDAFLAALRRDINEGVAENAAIGMLAQHLITKPIFDALFEGEAFARENPVAQAMDKMTAYLESEHATSTETKALEQFYTSIQRRISQVEGAESKQQIIKDLYGEFFKLAMPKAAASLGIVYTPVEAVDFILRSVEDVLHTEFGASLGSEGVHVIDPFVGTGTFIARLLSGGLVKPEDLARKYANELHANEIVLLAYYIAAANIENSYREAAESVEYSPFPGIILADTFEIGENRNRPQLSSEFIKGNSERLERQKAADIRVIIGNPPWSIGQRSQNDDNQNREYPSLRARVSETYAKKSTAKLQKALYDTYIQAIRWASDRISESKEGGVIALITNGGFIDGASTDGLRKALNEEFNLVYCLNLRGDQRTQGEKSRREGGKVFGSGSRAGVAILILVQQPPVDADCTIRYHDVGDYFTREQKLAYLAENNIASIPWQTITPNNAGDWITQRSDEFQTLLPLYGEGGVFRLNTNGLLTARDAWCYNFSTDAVRENTDAMMKFFNSETGKPIALINRNPTKFSWTGNTEKAAAQGRKLTHDPNLIVSSMYRAYCKQQAYFSREVNERIYRLYRTHPSPNSHNIGIMVTHQPKGVPFACLMTDVLPNYSTLGITSMYLPRWTYANAAAGYEQVSNINSAALTKFREHYSSDAITEDELFYYCYGVLHDQGYRAKFANDLQKEAARIPMATSLADFTAFADAGRALADLHVKYETVEPWPLEEVHPLLWDASAPDAYRVQKMAYAGTRPNLDRSCVVVNDGVTLVGIPEEAHEYRIGGRSALDWLIDRYQVKTDKDSGIVNDPNDWAEEHGDPRYILDLVKRIVTVSVRTTEIVQSLPTLPDCQ